MNTILTNEDSARTATNYNLAFRTPEQGVTALHKIPSHNLNIISMNQRGKINTTKNTDHVAASVNSLGQPSSNKGRDKGTMTQHLRALIDAIPGAVIVINAKGRVVDFNVAAGEILEEPLIDELWRDVVNRVFLAELDQGELRTRDGRQFSISTKPLGYEPGQILLLSDVTQTRQLQRAAQQNLHLMTMGKMVASLAHQIRTPLASSMLYLSQVVDGNMAEDKNHKFTGKALARIKHIEKMINDMLTFAHGGKFHMSEFNVTELMSDLYDQIQPQVKVKQVDLDIQVLQQDILMNGNKDALLGALANICMNAMDASQQFLRITIRVAMTPQSNVEISLTDNGCGMDELVLQQLFNPFFTTKTDGTGLGLAVVKSVVESHQGSIQVTSAPGQGSCFKIQLPCSHGSKSQLSRSSEKPLENGK